MTCVVCGGALPPRCTVTCSKACRTKRLVTSDAYARAQRNRNRSPRPAQQRYLVTRTCIVCGSQWKTGRAEAKYCSPSCKGAAYKEREFNPTHLHSRSSAARRRLRRASAGRSSSVLWQEGPCRVCGERFTAKGRPSFCSTACATKAKRLLKRGRHAIRRQRIFERDEYVCGLCGEPTSRTARVPHPLAPTVDHIIPSNQGGTNDESNLQCAHFLCNSAKGDRLPPHGMHTAA